MNDDTDLKFRQAAATHFETSLKQFLFESASCGNMKVGDIIYIAEIARNLAFDAFTKPKQL